MAPVKKADYDYCYNKENIRKVLKEKIILPKEFEEKAKQLLQKYGLE